jgi:hypothetical protein
LAGKNSAARNINKNILLIGNLPTLPAACSSEWL